MKSKLGYYWIITTACVIFAVFGMGMANYTLSLYVKPICDDLGFSRGVYSFVYTIAYVFQMISCLVFGVVQKKLGGVKKVFLIGTASLIIAFTIYSQAKNIFFFYIGAAFFGIGIGYAAAVPWSVIVSNWFIKKRSTVLSIIFSGSSIGGVILNPIVGKWIAIAGWRSSYLFSILLMVIFLIPAYLVLKEKPSDMGLEPFGFTPDNSLNHNFTDTSKGPTLEQVWKTTLFWRILGAIFLFGIAIQPVYINSAAHLSEAGFNPQLVSFIMGVVFLSNTLSKILLGIVNDKYGTKPVLIISNSFFCIGTLLLISTINPAFGFAFAVTFGVAYTMNSIIISMLISTLYEGRDYGKILGIAFAFQTAGNALGTPLSSLFFDLFHSYSYAFALAIILDLIAAILVLIPYNKSHR